MARKKNQPQPIEPEDETQEVEIEEQEVEEEDVEESDAPAVSKAEAVRQAIAAGAETPDDGVEFILNKFGIEITKPHFSAAKSLMKKREGIPNGKPGRKPGPGRPASRGVEGYLAPPPRQRTGPSADILDAMESLKPLIAQMGADKVKRMIDLLG